MKWLSVSVLLQLSLAVGCNQPAGEEQPYDPLAEARCAVDGFLRAYYRGLDDSLLLRLIGNVNEWCITLREDGDSRLVAPLIEIISDTTSHSDDVTAGAIYVLRELRARPAVSAVRRYLNMHSKARSRLQAAAALAILGEAEAGVPVLEEYARHPEPLFGGYVYTTIMYAFSDNSRAVRLDNSVQESTITSYFQRMAEAGQNLDLAVCYLLQKDEKSQAIALRRAEDVLRASAASKGAIAVPRNLLGFLRKFGGERGRAILDRYR